MSRMKVIAAKLTDNPHSTKIVYEKNGKIYVRTAYDDFKRGEPLQCNEKDLYLWGYRKVSNPPVFRDSIDICSNIQKFSIKSDGTIGYHG